MLGMFKRSLLKLAHTRRKAPIFIKEFGQGVACIAGRPLLLTGLLAGENFLREKVAAGDHE